MRLIWEENIEGYDFLEVILTPEQYKAIPRGGFVKEFKNGILKNPLNIFIHIEEELDDSNCNYIIPGEL